MNVRSPVNYMKQEIKNWKINEDNQLNNFDENDTEKAMDNDYP